MKREIQSPATYDNMFAEGGAGGVFDLPYRRSGYYPLFKAVARLVDQAPASVLTQSSGSAAGKATRRRVLEVGCGTGAMAHLLLDQGRVEYQGFDFSPVAVNKARQRTGVEGVFRVGDATDPATYGEAAYDVVVCTEVLEHIEQDLDAVRQWRSGAWCVCSVPNYDSSTHVRVFKDEQSVRSRYGELIDITHLQRLRKPFLTDLSLTSWLNAVRWNRYRPRRLGWLLGFTDFDRDGGWFVFAGRRR
jgi:SAM-dependent methyltransferase